MTIKQLEFVVTRSSAILVIPMGILFVLTNPSQAIPIIFAMIASIGFGVILSRYIIRLCVRVFNRYPDMDADQITIGHIFDTEKIYWGMVITNLSQRLKR